MHDKDGEAEAEMQSVAEQTLVARWCDTGEHPLDADAVFTVDVLRSRTCPDVLVWVTDCGRHRAR